METESSGWDRLWDSVDNVVTLGLPAYLDNDKPKDTTAAQYPEKSKPAGNIEPISGGIFGVQVNQKNIMFAGIVLIGAVIIFKLVR